MSIFIKNNIKDMYLAGADTMADDLFGNLADNTCWYALVNSDKKSYLITGASTGEGKTTVAVNLAIHIAKMDKKVLLIDANLRNPSLGKIFDTGDFPGLTQIMCNQIAPSDAIYKVNGYNFHLITSGKIEHEPSKVLTSSRMKDFLGKAKEVYDFIIIDSPAVNSYLDPLLLCPLVDEVVFVVMADKTEKSEVFIAKAKILDAGGKILGVILNRINSIFFIS